MAFERRGLVTHHDGKVQAIQRLSLFSQFGMRGGCLRTSEGREVLSGLRVRGIDVTALLAPRHQRAISVLDDLIRLATGMLGLLLEHVLVAMHRAVLPC